MNDLTVWSLVEPPRRPAAAGIMLPSVLGTPRISVDFPESADAFKIARNGAFYDWWMSANGGACPLRRQFDIVDHPDWAANIFLARVEQTDPWVYRFRLIGNDAVRLMGRNDTGLTLAETGWDRFDGTGSRAYADMMTRRRPVRFHGSLGIYDRDYAAFESIDAPLVDDEGNMTTVIGLICGV